MIPSIQFGIKSRGNDMRKMIPASFLSGKTEDVFIGESRYTVPVELKDQFELVSRFQTQLAQSNEHFHMWAEPDKKAPWLKKDLEADAVTLASELSRPFKAGLTQLGRDVRASLTGRKFIVARSKPQESKLDLSGLTPKSVEQAHSLNSLLEAVIRPFEFPNDDRNLYYSHEGRNRFPQNTPGIGRTIITRTLGTIRDRLSSLREPIQAFVDRNIQIPEHPKAVAPKALFHQAASHFLRLTAPDYRYDAVKPMENIRVVVPKTIRPASRPSRKKIARPATSSQ